MVGDATTVDTTREPEIVVTKTEGVGDAGIFKLGEGAMPLIGAEELGSVVIEEAELGVGGVEETEEEVGSGDIEEKSRFEDVEATESFCVVTLIGAVGSADTAAGVELGLAIGARSASLHLI